MLNMLPSAKRMRADIYADQKKFKKLLRHYQLRPTKQRLIIATHLFQQAKRHVHAEMLYEEIAASGEIISVATIYNSLRHFCHVGLIRTVASRGIRQWFCTDINNMCQCYFDDGEHIEPWENLTVAFPGNNITAFNGLQMPDLPSGYRVAHIDISIHLEKCGEINELRRETK